MTCPDCRKLREALEAADNYLESEANWREAQSRFELGSPERIAAIDQLRTDRQHYVNVREALNNPPQGEGCQEQGIMGLTCNARPTIGDTKRCEKHQEAK